MLELTGRRSISLSYPPELSGDHDREAVAVSQGREKGEARENIIDALRLMLSPDDDDPSAVAGRSEQLDLPASDAQTPIADVSRPACGVAEARGDSQRVAWLGSGYHRQRASVPFSPRPQVTLETISRVADTRTKRRSGRLLGLNRTTRDARVASVPRAGWRRREEAEALGDDDRLDSVVHL